MGRRGLANAGTKPGGGGDTNNNPLLLGVNAIIPSNGPWSGDNQLGIEVEFSPDASLRQTILKLDEWGFPEEWTISLYTFDDDNDYESVGIKANIAFGCGGSTQIITVDWGQGVEITKTMNAVNVIAEYSNLVDLSQGNGLRLGVQLARGTRGGNLPPRVTISHFLLQPGESVTDIRVPNFAAEIGFVALLNQAAYDPLVSLLAKTGNAGVPGPSGTLFGDQAKTGQMMPVFADTRFLTLTNGSANPVNLQLYANLYG